MVSLPRGGPCNVFAFMRWQTLREARWIVAILAAATVAAWFVTPWLSAAGLALVAFTLYFFRDPRREIPSGPGLIVSPADGRVTDIEDIDENEWVNRRMRRVGIFLSVFDVHVNRAPADCRVVYTAEYPGTYHDARSPLASTHNAARTWAFECRPDLVLVVRQVTGAIARRIVPWAGLDERLVRGQHFGMIRFGSRTEICLPLDAEVTVKVGQHVKGGSTVIARLPEP